MYKEYSRVPHTYDMFMYIVLNLCFVSSQKVLSAPMADPHVAVHVSIPMQIAAICGACYIFSPALYMTWHCTPAVQAHVLQIRYYTSEHFTYRVHVSTVQTGAQGLALG
jgi:hypothetical protein